jgi:hypothetical protein
MLFLLLMGVGLFIFGRRTVSTRITDDERTLRMGLLVRSMFRWDPDRLLPVVGGFALEVCGVLMVYSALLP